jgi:hypothetical protein
VQREHAAESVDEGCRCVGAFFVEVGDRAREPANCVLGVLDE